MPKRTKRRKLKARVLTLEKKVAQLDREMHPSAKELTDALWDVIQYHQKNQTFARCRKALSSEELSKTPGAGNQNRID